MLYFNTNLVGTPFSTIGSDRLVGPLIVPKIIPGLRFPSSSSVHFVLFWSSWCANLF